MTSNGTPYHESSAWLSIVDTVSESPTPESIAYREAVRAIDQQERMLDELRSRTGLLLVGASVAASFLGARTPGRSGLDALTILSIVAFAAVIVISLCTLWPRRGWRFALGPEVLLDDWAGPAPPGDGTQMEAFLARKLDANWQTNESKLRCLYGLFQLAVIALGAEVILWVVALA